MPHLKMRRTCTFQSDPCASRYCRRAGELPGLVPMAGLDEARKQRVRRERPRLEFRVELHREVPWVIRQLGNLHELAVPGAARDLQPGGAYRLFVETVELVAMPVPLVNQRNAVDAVRQ